jgi:DNA invertase Pin-like site-specific DNA recombinase
MPKVKPRCYSYLRFSTPEQAKGDSLRRQTALAEEYAKRYGLQLDTELTLRDLGVSAFRGANRAVGALGGFLQAISDGLVPKGSLLLVEALDRVSRQESRKAVRLLEDIVEAGVTVVTLNDGKAYTAQSLDGMDFVYAILLFMRGHEESATKAKRGKAAWAGKRERAARRELVTTRVPAWLRAEGSAAKDYRDARLTLIPERASLIRRMFAMFLDGRGKHAIAETFNAEKIPTWGAGKGRGAARHWHRTYVFKILSNPAVTGVFTPHVEEHRDGKKMRVPQEPIAGYYPRVIDDVTFERVQTLIKARTKTVRTGKIASIVAGLARCPMCGSTMTRVMKGTPKKRGIPKLVCTKAKAGAGCKYHAVALPDVEQAFADSVSHFRNPPLAEADLAAEIDGADNVLYEVQKEIKELVRAIKIRASDTLSKELAECEAHAARVKAVLEVLRERAAETESRVVALRAKRLADAVADLKPDTFAAANAALRECLESVTVDYPEGVLRLSWRHGPKTELRFDAGSDFQDLDAAEARST